MHPALTTEFKNLKALSKQRGIALAVIETQLENVVFISVDERLVCLALEEGKIHNMLSCFKVDLSKWKWAEKEGFKLKDGLPQDLIDEILIKFRTPDEYLDYLNLL